MAGNIYTEQCCRICGAKLVHIPAKNGLFCPAHPKERATGRFFVRFGRKVNKRFKNYEGAARFLNKVRWEKDHDTFDPLDYRADCPYAFDKLAKEYLEEKQSLASYGKIRRHIQVAIDFFDSTNVKKIKRRDLKEFMRTLSHLTSKTQANYMTQLRNFFTKFLVEEEVLAAYEVPSFPDMSFELGYRKICGLDVQAKIMDRLRDDSWGDNPKLWLAADLLRTYLVLRPGDLLRVKEDDVRLDLKAIILWRPTKRRGLVRKAVHLLDEHVELLQEMKDQFPALPSMPFFRHHVTGNNVRAGDGWSDKTLYARVKKACVEEGYPELDMYGLLRHSTATAAAIEFGEDDARAATQHQTNKAFDRYCQAEAPRAVKMAQRIGGMHNKKVVKMEKAKKG